MNKDNVGNRERRKKIKRGKTQLEREHKESLRRKKKLMER